MISFAEKYPDLVGEWAPENEASPSEVSYGSNRMIMWRGMCGHYWTASAKNRGKGHGCPYCSGMYRSNRSRIASLFFEKRVSKF